MYQCGSFCGSVEASFQDETHMLREGDRERVPFSVRLRRSKTKPLELCVMGWKEVRDDGMTKWQRKQVRDWEGRRGQTGMWKRELLRNERGTQSQQTHTQENVSEAALSHIHTRTACLCGICEQLRKKLNKRKTMTSLFSPNKLFFCWFFSIFLCFCQHTVKKSPPQSRVLALLRVLKQKTYCFRHFNLNYINIYWMCTPFSFKQHQVFWSFSREDFSEILACSEQFQILLIQLCRICLQFSSRCSMKHSQDSPRCVNGAKIILAASQQTLTFTKALWKCKLDFGVKTSTVSV